MGRQQLHSFKETVWDYYRSHGRSNLAWRCPGPDGRFDPYAITVSEIMLQQTQVSRVTVKYVEFLERFPTVHALAEAPLADVLRMWSGLGYNRRAQFLHRAAQAVVADYSGEFPRTQAELERLPGIGPNTAGAIMAYAYNQPVIFIETNIRTVYIHHFFADKTDVADKQLQPLIAQSLDHEQPREWYWALMDYGSYLKKTAGNLNRSSRHYARQSLFEGSRRQVRGRVMRLLGEGPHSFDALAQQLDDERLGDVLEQLMREGLVQRTAGEYHL